MAYKFIKIPDPDNPHDNSSVEISTSHNEFTVDELCQEFDSFLKACGYYYDGRVEIVEEDD